MRLLVDECTGPTVTAWLREQGHDVLDAFETARGADDTNWMRQALAEQRVLITNDKDFGDYVYLHGMAHDGVILLRLQDETPLAKFTAIRRVLELHGEELIGEFVVVTERKIRFARRS